MSARSCQAWQLALQLASQAAIPVEVAYDGGRGYLIQWGDGPTTDDMSALVTAELPTGRYPDLPAGLLRSFRGYTARAFAARAAAASRDGSLTTAIDAGAATRRWLGLQRPSWSRLSDAEHDAHHHIEQLLSTTPSPAQPDDPADEPAITALLHASGGSEYTMLPALLQARRPAEQQITCPESGENARERPPRDLVDWAAHGITPPAW